MPQRIKTINPRAATSHMRQVRLGEAGDHRLGSSSQRGYDGKWQKARRGWLARHPLCVCCEAHQHLEPATVIDHVVPHRGDRALFWRSNNWQALCAWCHNNLKASIERAVERGDIDARFLSLARTVAGWRHPADR